jgi:hypothetical protein
MQVDFAIHAVMSGTQAAEGRHAYLWTTEEQGVAGFFHWRQWRVQAQALLQHGKAFCTREARTRLRTARARPGDRNIELQAAHAAHRMPEQRPIFLVHPLAAFRHRLLVLLRAPRA